MVLQGWLYHSYLLLLFIYVRLRQWFAWTAQESKKLDSMSSHWPFLWPRHSFCWPQGCRKMCFQCWSALQNFSGQCSFFQQLWQSILCFGSTGHGWVRYKLTTAPFLFISTAYKPEWLVYLLVFRPLMWNHSRHLFRGSALLSAAEIHAPVGHQIGLWVWVHSVLLSWLSVWKPHCLVWKPHCPSHLSNRMGMENPSDGILLNSGRSDKTPWQCQLGLDKSTW